MAGLAQEPVTFEDVMVFLSRAEWDALAAGQRELYRDVVSDTYELLTSLGYPGPKPDILHRLERGEEPWICPSPGHIGSWLEEPPSGWWPRRSRCQGPEPSCPAGQSTSWCLQAGRLLKNFGCLEERSEFPTEVDSGVGSQAQPWPVKEEVEDKPELVEILIQSETFPLHSLMEQQDVDPLEQLWDDPGEWNHRNTQSHGHTSGEVTLLLGNRELRVEELRAAVAKDHSYCLRSEPGTPCARRAACALWEHNYCRLRGARKRHRPRGGGAAWAMRCRLARRRSCFGRMVRKAREIVRHYRLYRRSGLPWRGCSVCRAQAQRTRPGVSVPTGAAAPGDLWSAGNTKGVTLDTQHIPDGTVGTGSSPSAPILAAGTRKGARPPEDPSANRELAGRVESQKSQGVSLHDMFQNVLRVVRYMLDSMCQKIELQGFSQGKSIWPIVIQIDNLTEIGKP